MEKNEMIFKCVNTRAPYIVDEENKCLRQLHLTKVVYDLQHGLTDLTWIEAETGKLIVGDLSDKKVFVNEEHFQKGEILKQTDLYAERNINEVIYTNLSCRNAKVDGKRYYSWVYRNGHADKFYYDEEIGAIKITFGDDGKGAKKAEADIELPETYYDVEEVYDFNDYEVVNNDGTKSFHEGLCKRLRLTDEQNVMLDKLQAMLDECGRAGIQIAFDLCDYQLTAFNKANVERIEYDPGYDEEEEICHSLNLRESRTLSGVYDINTDDSSLQFVVAKNTLKTSK